MATGIKDKVAILGMGCSKFGERWNDNAEDLMLEAFTEALMTGGPSARCSIATPGAPCSWSERPASDCLDTRPARGRRTVAD